MHKAHCPNCDAEINKDNSRVGVMITCDECSTELEIISVNPFEVDFPLDYCGDWDEQQEEGLCGLIEKLDRRTITGGTEMTLNVKPLGDRIVVEPLVKEVETFAGGQLVLPDTAKEKPQKGKVLAVGPGRIDDGGSRIPIEVEVGATVVYAKYSGTSFKTEDGSEVLFMRESDVLAVLES